MTIIHIMIFFSCYNASAEPYFESLNYNADILIRCHYGSGKNQIGYLPHREINNVSYPAYGPRSFDIDNEANIYILDSVNAQVLKFDTSGKFNGSIDIGPRYEQNNLWKMKFITIAVDNNGNIYATYVSNRGTFKRFSISTKRESIKTLDINELLLNMHKTKRENDANIIDQQEQKFDIISLDRMNNGKILISGWSESYIFDGQMNTVKNQDNIINNEYDSENVCKDHLGRDVKPQFIDKMENMYRWGDGGGPVFFIEKYTKECKRQSIQLKPKNTIGMKREVIIKPNGIIYQMWAGESQLEIIRYTQAD